jgi:hypothetical protein
MPFESPFVIPPMPVDPAVAAERVLLLGHDWDEDDDTDDEEVLLL